MLLSTLYERVLGNLAIGYHRTRNLKNTNAIGASGFKIGARTMYGAGVYLTYDFDDQQDERMKQTYGPFIVRCKITLNDFLIFDPDVAARVYPTHPSIEAQLASFGPPKEFVLPATAPGDFTSVAARQFAGYYHTRVKKFQRAIKGIVFTGAQDGRVIVAFDASVVTALSWARVIDLNKTAATVKWNALATPATAKADPYKISGVEQGYRFFRRNNFRLISKGPAGARLIGMVAGNYVTIKITAGGATDVKGQFGSTVEAYVTRQDPQKLPTYESRAGHRLIHQHYPNAAERLPFAQILQTVLTAVQGLEVTKARHIQFATTLLHRIVQAPAQVKQTEGRDFRTDQVLIQAGSVRLEFDDPYADRLSGKVFITTNSFTLDLGFSDGIRDSDVADLDLGYHTIFNSMHYLSRIEHKYLADGTMMLPDDLQPAFKADLLAAIPSR